MREEIRTINAVFELGNMLRDRWWKPRWLTVVRPGAPDGYDLYRPKDMNIEEQMCYEDVVRMARHTTKDVRVCDG